MNWFKQSWNHGIPLMDQYQEFGQPSRPSYKSKAKPEFGGNVRRDYPIGLNPGEDDGEASKLRDLPGENPLMDQDPPTGEGVNNEEFTAEGEFTTNQSDDDRLPTKARQIDNIDVGPHNMQSGALTKVKNRARVRGLNVL